MTGAAASAGGRDLENDAPSGPDRLAGIVFAVLVAACFVAFFVTQRLKHTPTVVQRFQLATSFSPTAAAHDKQEQISFIVARTDRVTVAIIDSRGDVVATLVRNHPVIRYRRLSLRWNGRRGTAHRVLEQTTARGHTIYLPQNHGRIAPAGEYRVRVSLRSRDLPVLSPRTFTLVKP